MNIHHTHSYLQARFAGYQQMVDLATERIEQAKTDERGLTSTEVAILAFVLTGIAIALGTVLWNVVEGRAGAISEIENPTFDVSD